MAPTSSRIVNGVSLPSLPWEERLDGSDAVIWRSARNPIIPCDLIPSSNSIFNSAVVPYQGCLLYTSPSPRDRTRSRMPSSA